MFHVQSFHKLLNRALLGSVFFVLLFTIFTSFPMARTILNFGQWQNLNSLSKTTYVAGVIDTLLNPLNKSDHNEMFLVNFELCLKRLNITTFEIANMVDNFYLNHSNRALSPQIAIRFQLLDGHCFQFLNE